MTADNFSKARDNCAIEKIKKYKSPIKQQGWQHLPASARGGRTTETSRGEALNRAEVPEAVVAANGVNLPSDTNCGDGSTRRQHGWHIFPVALPRAETFHTRERAPLSCVLHRTATAGAPCGLYMICCGVLLLDSHLH